MEEKQKTFVAEGVESNSDEENISWKIIPDPPEKTANQEGCRLCRFIEVCEPFSLPPCTRNSRRPL